MAFKLAELFVDITGRDSQFRTVMGLVEKRVGAATIAIGTMAGNVLTGAIGKAGSAFTGILDTTMDLEDRMVGLQKATDLNPAGLAAMRDQIYSLATTLKGAKLEDLLDIATAGAKMGVATEDLATYVEGIAKVSAAMDDVPAAEIADNIGKINTIFGLGVGGALQMGSAIDKLADSGVSSAAGIMEVTQRFSGMAKAAGLTAQETVAMAAALLDTGTQTEAAAGALIQLTGTFASSENPRASMMAFLEKLSTMNAGEGLAALEGIGINADVTASEIMKLASQFGSLTRYTGLANEQFLTLDQINKSYAMSAGTSRSAMAQLGNQVRMVSEQIGKTLLRVFGAFQPAIAAILKGAERLFGDLGGDVQSYMPMIEAFAARLAQLGPVIGVAWRELPTTIRLVGSVLRDVFTNAVGVVQNLLVGLAKFAADLFGQIGQTLSVHLENAVKDAAESMGDLIYKLTLGQVNVSELDGMNYRRQAQPIRPDLSLIGNPFEGTGWSDRTRDLFNKMSGAGNATLGPVLGKADPSGKLAAQARRESEPAPPLTASSLLEGLKNTAGGMLQAVERATLDRMAAGKGPLASGESRLAEQEAEASRRRQGVRTTDIVGLAASIQAGAFNKDNLPKEQLKVQQELLKVQKDQLAELRSPRARPAVAV